MTLRRVMIGAARRGRHRRPRWPARCRPRPRRSSSRSLVYRTGPYAPSGIPIANGFIDYFTLVNERDGGINGVKLALEECETQYDTKQGVECYERLKGKGGGAVVVNPLSTGHHVPAHPQGGGGQDRRCTRWATA